MNWGRLDEPTWWWEYALDGVVGGVIGGLVTALAVWLTLRHERKLSRDANDRDLVATDRAEARALAAQIVAATWKLTHDLTTGAWDDHDWEEEWPLEFVDFVRDMQALQWALDKHWPATAKKIGKRSKKLLKATDPDGITAQLSKAAGLAGAWSTDPARVERAALKTPPASGRLRRLRERIRARGRQQDS